MKKKEEGGTMCYCDDERKCSIIGLIFQLVYLCFVIFVSAGVAFLFVAHMGNGVLSWAGGVALVVFFLVTFLMGGGAIKEAADTIRGLRARQ